MSDFVQLKRTGPTCVLWDGRRADQGGAAVTVTREQADTLLAREPDGWAITSTKANPPGNATTTQSPAVDAGKE